MSDKNYSPEEIEKIKDAAVDLHSACVMIYEHFLFPSKHSVIEIKMAIEEALVKAQVLK